ncbi:chemotaxis protein CheX [uncultured Rhodospira sp.]|uniref:chemotaxis protein CheX n=1 Tax=uncultured Rhodospira sp. TaxID=1936189 RepID=UPI002624AF37|nr:chemotaxis protein CheX [uncultured Rhodospira sp.]
MMQPVMPLTSVMASVLRRTRRVLLASTAVNVEAVERYVVDAPTLELHDVTAVGGFNAPLGVRAAFSFERSLLEVLYGRFTADIAVPDGQEDLYVHDTAAEIANLILGLCSGDFPNLDGTIALIPVVVLTEERHIDRRDHAVFGTMRMRAPDGRLDVHLLRPKEMFDDQLNHLPPFASGS